MIKLQKYLNNPRNFQNEITSKQSFIDFNNFLNKKIKETLFDINLISNSIINEEKKDILLLEIEQNEIFEMINKIENKNMNKNINGVKENINYDKDMNNNNNLFEINNKNINPYINVISNSASNNYSIISSTNNSCQSTSNKKNNSNYFSEDEEKSLSLLSKEIKNEKADKEKEINMDKNRIYISKLNDIKIYNFLNFIKQKENKYIKIKINKEQIIKIFEEIINGDGDGDGSIDIDIKNVYLRKNACLKLYKAFNFIFKKYNIKDIKIKQMCRILENRARQIDYNMGNIYKEYIINILKNLTDCNN